MWRKFKPHGYGKEWIGKRLMYEGEFVEGRKEGKGRHWWHTHEGERGLEYEGEFRSNIMEGKGWLTWSDGREYIGDFTNNMKDGFGEFKWPGERAYRGFWREGRQHGFGVYSELGVEERGEWEEGKLLRWLAGENALLSKSML